MARLQSATAAGASAVSSKVGVQVGNDRWLVNLSDVSEAVPVPQLLTVPLTRRWFEGVANVRGVLYGVVDFSEFLGGEPTQINVDSRLLLINPRYSINAGLIVHHMLGLKNAEQFQPAEERELPEWVAAEYVDPDGHVWKELRMQGLVNQPDFLNVGI